MLVKMMYHINKKHHLTQNKRLYADCQQENGGLAEKKDS
jgi:hypothetical protein